MPKKKTATTDVPVVNYTELSDELAELMARLETGELGIDEALVCYERGLAIVALLEAHLQKAENKVTALREA